MDNQNYNNQVNPFQMQNPQPAKKKSKAVIIVIIAVLIAIIAAAGIVIVKILSENAEESEREKKPYTGGHYVVNSKCTSAHSTASSVYKAVNTVLTELDEMGVDISYTGIIDFDDTWAEVTDFSKDKKLTSENARELMGYGIKEYFSSLDEIKEGRLYLYDGMCVGVVCTTDDEYWGSSPVVIGSDEYIKAKKKFTMDDVDKVMKDIIAERYVDFFN